jgi:hypothetical protein
MNLSEAVTLVPLIALAGSSIAYVVKLFLDRADKRRDRFFDLMKLIDGKESIALKVAAIYELRQFPEHKDFIVHFCETQSKNVAGVDSGAKSLIAEMNRTKDYFSGS